MIRWLRSLFAWQVEFEAGVWAYSINTVTGRRAANHINTGGFSPPDWEWLLASDEMPLIDGKPAWRSGWRNTLPDRWQWS